MNNSDKKMTWQSSLDEISAMYISAKEGKLRWDKDRVRNFINWIDSLTK